MHIIGTAGHVDHGKSALVRALTGTDPDRFIEEQLRGMTLDLGFAHLRYDDGTEAGIVDVPGHERFLHNMLAGAAGMEVLLLVVAANEGPMPQTREHLAILDYLNVRRAIVVLTKADLVDPEELALTTELVTEMTRNTVAANAALIPVSSVTGEGLDDLRRAIHDALVALPPRAPQAPAYLPIDRVFALPGHGTIVTGTLMQGRLAVGDRVRLQPSGRDARLRSIQVFGTRRDVVDAGARVAMNLPGIETAEIVRGDVVADPQFVPQRAFDVTFRPVAAALGGLRRRTPVRVYLGSAEVLGTLAFASVPETVAPASAQLRLRHPVIAIPGAAFVVRRLTPKELLGGGTIAVAIEETLDDESDAPDVATLGRILHQAGLAAITVTQLAALANLREDRVEAIANELVAAGRLRRIAKPFAYIDGAAIESAFAMIVEILESRQRTTPYALGTTSLALARFAHIEESLLVRILASYLEEGRLAYRVGYYATTAFTPSISDEQRAFFESTIPRSDAEPFLPASLEAVITEVKRSKIPGLIQAFDTLVALEAFIKVGDALYRGPQISTIRNRVESYFRKTPEMTMAQFRDLIGTSRKYAVPLLEWFDASGLTVRNGDVRRLRERR